MNLIKKERSLHGHLEFKSDHNEDSEFNAINIRKYIAGRPQSLKSINHFLLHPKDIFS